MGRYKALIKPNYSFAAIAADFEGGERYEFQLVVLVEWRPKSGKDDRDASLTNILEWSGRVVAQA